MRRIYLLLLTIPILVFSCKKDHPGPRPNPVTPGAPKMSTDAVIDITDNSAASGGTFVVEGTDTINFKGNQWDTTNLFQHPWATDLPGGYYNFVAFMFNLFPNTVYYVRAYSGTDSQHIYYGDTIQFKTTYTPGNYLVSTLAGTGSNGFTNGRDSAAMFYGPVGVAVDKNGNIYVADNSNMAIRKITPSGDVSTLAVIDGKPNDVIVDSAGNVYVGESTFKILKITASGQVSTFAGAGQQGHADGTGTAATFWAAITLAIDPAGNLYVGDVYSFRKITPAGVVTTLPSYFAANSSWVIGVDGHFNLYECDTHTAIRIDSSGNESFLAGNGQKGDADGTGSAASFGFLFEFRMDSSGNIYTTDATNNKIRMISPGGTVTTIAGTGALGAVDGNAAMATFNAPVGLAIDKAGNIIVGDQNNNKIRKISPQ